MVHPWRHAAIAYRTVNHVAVTIADPIGPKGSLDDAIDRFIGCSDRNGWTAAFYSVHKPSPTAPPCPRRASTSAEITLKRPIIKLSHVHNPGTRGGTASAPP